MEELDHLHGKGVLLEPPLHARCGHSEIAIQELSLSKLIATHFDRIYLGQSRILSIPAADGPVFIPCRVARSQVTDWREEKTGRCLYRSVFEFQGLTDEMKAAIERVLLGHGRAQKKA